MSTLHELAGDYLALSELSDNPEVDFESLEAAMNNIEGELTEKCTNVAMFIQNREAMVQAIDGAIKKMQARKRVLQNRIASTKSYLKENMEASEISRIESPHFVLSIAKNPPAVHIDDEGAIPAKYKTEVVTVKIDKAAIKTDGGCTGAHLESGTRLVIK